MKKGSPVRSLNAPGPSAPPGSTPNNRPKTAFMARSDVAMPPLRLKKSRRLNPSRGARRPASSRILSSTVRCAAVCGSGGNSSLETSRVGRGISERSPRRMPGRMRKAWGLEFVMSAFPRGERVEAPAAQQGGGERAQHQHRAHRVEKGEAPDAEYHAAGGRAERAHQAHEEISEALKREPRRGSERVV